MELVERDEALQALESDLRSVASGTGRVAFIAGEAGIGKTSLLKALAARSGNTPRRVDLWWGNCDALQTPHPLAPLHDIARSSDVRFGALLRGDDSRAAVFEAVLTELTQKPRPVLLVIEDAHWADDASLDLIKFLGRRIDRVACLLAISYRDDEVPTMHPLRRVLGELPSSLVTRLDLPRLSPTGVETLARSAFRSPAGVYSATHGNPFFVTEVLRHGIDTVPRSVQDLVLARFARLSPEAQSIVRLASLVPAKIERWLADDLLGVNVAAIEECLNSGLLLAAASTLSFRHELARVAIESSISDPLARASHADIFRALERGSAPVSLARLVHHATRAGDIAAVMRYAPDAARQAQQREAHREAAAHYRTALEHSNGMDNEHAAWLDAYARECMLTGQLTEAITARLRLHELHKRAANKVGEAENLSQLAVAYVGVLRNAEADVASRRAIELLETLAPSVALAGAYRVEGSLRMLNRDCEASVEWSTKAIQLAEQFGDRETIASATSTLGTAMLFLDYEAGCAQLHRAIDLARADELHHIAASAYGNLGSGSGELFRLREGERYLKQAISFAQRHELDTARLYATSWLALCEMYLGRWEDAFDNASDVIQQTTSSPSISRVMALVALGRLQTRRGDPHATETLDEALELALASQTLQRLGPVRAVRAEAAWWRGNRRAAADEAESALKLAIDHRHPWLAGELAYWLWRADALTAVPSPCAEPFALQISGRWREAAQAWAELGCPFEQARALSDGDQAAQLEALEIFEHLDARPAADQLRQQLKTAGQRKLPRRARSSTKSNPHQLTAREIEVLLLLCEGLKNSEIAERLCRSVRTIDHHLESVFGKLNVTTRTEAVAAATRAGIRAKNGQASVAI